jgi:predicted CoA-substrate-specific enzyme activase
MFFRIKPSGPYRYPQLVENHRDGYRTVQRVLFTVGRLDKLTATGSVDSLLRSLARFCQTCGWWSPATGGEVVSEVRAFAVGTRHLVPECRTIIDIGGQDWKAIALSPSGEVRRFEMNDRCAAGTGKFLEVMAATLEVDMAGLAPLALRATRQGKVNALCTVFAESEVVSLIARGEDTAAIALALHDAVATRVATMARRLAPEEVVVFAGGGALNPCLARLLREKLRKKIVVPECPQTVGALGAAIITSNSP